MKKVLNAAGASLAEALCEGAVIFPNMIFVGLVYKNYGELDFVRPFVLVYALEKAILFLLSGLGSIQNPKKLLLLTYPFSILGCAFMCLGGISPLFWSIGAVFMGVGLAAFNPLYRSIRDALKECGEYKNKFSMAAGYVVFSLFLLMIVLVRYKNLISVFLVFGIYLAAVLAYLLSLNVSALNLPAKPIDLTGHKTSNILLAFFVFAVLFALRMYKQTADRRWIAVFSIAGPAMLLLGIFAQKTPLRTHSLNCIWYGAMRNLMAIFSLIYFTAIGKPKYVMYAYLLIGLGVALSKIVAMVLKKIIPESWFEVCCIALAAVSLLPMIIPNDSCYLAAILFSCVFTAAGSSHAIKAFVADDTIRYYDRRFMRYKLYGFGAVVFQLFMMSVLFLVSILNHLEGTEPLEAYTYSSGNAVYTGVFAATKLICVLAFVISGAAVIIYNLGHRKGIEPSNKILY